MKRKLIVVFGKSGSGKDTFVDALIDRDTDIYEKVVRYTSRPKREGEIHGDEYYFVDPSWSRGKSFIEKHWFNNWFYGTKGSDLSLDKVNVMTGSVETFSMLMKRNSEDLDVLGVRLEMDDLERFERTLYRESPPNLEHICKRYLSELEQYSGMEEFFHIQLNSSLPVERLLEAFYDNEKTKDFLEGGKN